MLLLLLLIAGTAGAAAGDVGCGGSGCQDPVICPAHGSCSC
jgi:hypothetical protein